ncbi:bifunctional sterol desaturase/short chain dehydrogenase [Merismopedia glauca]|uniref:Sterol desaturase n=1 Tax=Merismopedia glauca CCAP 1448/3 TaxID=1296344 RepID=A0A2T1C6Z5_9CYAN|nr:bifunctional sterol desaturase/short chain dehydrogenase [Merismopedia glauca]PSB04055.1 sterol desaturase [Merismopedia glauca CCAP 1448/3]
MAIAWGLGSILWAEIIRDVYHLVSHYYPPLYRQHVWHHRVFRRDLTFANPKIYQEAQWHNDFPECLVMLAFGIGLWWVCQTFTPDYQWAAALGILYTLLFLVSCIARASGSDWAREATDATHKPGAFLSPPGNWFVNRPYHWRHHFDDDKAYYCGTFTLVDKVMGTALSLKGKTIAVTGASGTLGKALLQQLHLAGAKVIALTSQSQAVKISIDGEFVDIKTINWQIGQESELASVLEKVDILVLNHGVNVYGDRTADAIAKSYQINTFSSLKLMEAFFATVRTNQDIALKEVWVNTSEAEVNPAFSPLYELTKRALGDLVTLKRLDAPCVVRKLILGPFKSDLNPVGIMSADWVAKQIVALAKRDVRNIIVTINPLTYLLFPIKEFCQSWYFRLFSQAPATLNLQVAQKNLGAIVPANNLTIDE